MKRIGLFSHMRIWITGILIVGFFLNANAQMELLEKAKWKKSYSPKENLTIGDIITITFDVDIDDGFHMYSAVPPEGAPMLAATFDLDPTSTGIELVDRLQDKGGTPESGYDDVFEANITIYHDKVTYTQQLKITEADVRMDGFVRYQVCDASLCVPGVEEMSFVAKATAPKAPVVVPKTEPEASPSKEDGSASVQKGEQKEPPVAAKTTSITEAEEAVPVLETAPIQDPNFTGAGELGGTRDLLAAMRWERITTLNGEVVDLKKINVKPEDEITLTFKAKLEPGIYIYSTVPPATAANTPTAFAMIDAESRGVERIGGTEEVGAPKEKFDEVFKTTVRYFTEEATFVQRFRVTEANPHIEGRLEFQVCDDSSCVPGTEDVSISLSTALWRLFINGFFFGLLSVLTPCIFPLIPLTVSFFTKANDNRAKGIFNALFYGASIISIYTLLGIVVTLVLGADAMRLLSVNPWFNLALFAMIFAFSLSFLGMFDITLPSSWSTAIGKQSDKGGLVGIFLMALTLAIVSFSCTGPIVATALAEAARGSFMGPTVTMLGFSSAMALPFMLFAIFPTWLNSLPRSGGWLTSVKVSLGFIELALAFIYLSRADEVMHWGLLDREIFIGAWIVIAITWGIYLLGKIQLPHDSPLQKIAVPRLLLAMSIFWFALYLVPGLWGASLSMLGGYIPSSKNDIGVKLQDYQMNSGGFSPASATGGASTGTQADGSSICTYPDKVSGYLSEKSPTGFCAFYDLEQGLEYAREMNKPVFLDFTGHTCANCRYLEHNAWPDADIRRYITEEFVLISLYTDDREDLVEVEIGKDGKKNRTVGDKWIDYETEQYGSNAQPLYVLIDHDKSSLMSPKGFSPPLDIENYREFFKNGLAEFKRRHNQL